MQRLSTRSRWGLGAALVVILGAGGLAYATIPNSVTGQITVCYPTSGIGIGQLRVIDYQGGKRCYSNERMLSWQQNGMRYRGGWKSTVAYSTNDVVVSGGAAYIAVSASTNVAVTTTSRWAVLAGRPGPRPTGVVWVAKSGGDFTTVKAALASIKDNSASHRYVVKIAPGTYAEPGGIDLKNYVDLEGSGQDVTTITCACGSPASPASVGSSATLRATGATLHSEVRQLTVANSGPSTYSVGIWTGAIADHAVVLDHVTALASGGTGDYAIWNHSSSPAMRNIVATSTGNGTTSTESFAVTIADSNYSFSNGLAMDHVVATANGALANVGVRITGHTPVVRIAVVDASAGGRNDPAAQSYGFFFLDAQVWLNEVSAIPTLSNAGAKSWGADIIGTSQSTFENSYLEGIAAVVASSGTLTRITRSTLNGSTVGPGFFRCAFNVDGGGTPIGGSGC